MYYNTQETYQTPSYDKQKKITQYLILSDFLSIFLILTFKCITMKKRTSRETTFTTLNEVPKDPSQRAIKRLFPTRKSLRKSLAPTYYPVVHHIYYDGHNFRVRVRINGKTTSINTPDKTKAIKLRDRLLRKKARA